jgi:hypothetical protein
MLAVADAHKVGVASHENDEYVERVRSMVDEWQSQLQADIEMVRQGGPRPDRAADGKG